MCHLAGLAGPCFKRQAHSQKAAYKQNLCKSNLFVPNNLDVLSDTSDEKTTKKVLLAWNVQNKKKAQTRK